MCVKRATCDHPEELSVTGEEDPIIRCQHPTPNHIPYLSRRTVHSAGLSIATYGAIGVKQDGVLHTERVEWDDGDVAESDGQLGQLIE